MFFIHIFVHFIPQASYRLQDTTITPGVDYNEVVSLIRHLQDDGLMDAAVSEVLESPLAGDPLINGMEETLLSTHEGGFLDEIIKNAILVMWDVECIKTLGHPEFKMNKDTFSFAIGNEASLRLVDLTIVGGINELIVLGQLDNFLIRAVKGLLTSGCLDDIILTSLRQLQQQLQLEEPLVDAASEVLQSRQLDEILLTTAATLKDSGELDEVIVSVFTKILQSGNFDDKIKSVIINLQDKVSCFITFV